MTSRYAVTGARIFDGETTYGKKGLLVSDGKIEGICSLGAIPATYERVELSGGLITPGFVDLQVNGGGGVLFNDDPSVASIRTICAAHLQFGTTGLLPTLITDRPEVTTAAIEAGIQAAKDDVPGFLGLHLEGPHLSVAKKGAHDPAFIREMNDDDCEQLIAARKQLPNLMITVAPESVSNQQISRLAEAGIVVSLGHSAASLKQAKAAKQAGASCITHIFNAMSPLTHREPGMVGAGMARDGFFCGLIADGYHVDPEVIAILLAAKDRQGKVFLVSDAMSTIGTDIRTFELNGRTIFRNDGRLTLEDGTLAGADIELNTALKYLVDRVGVDEEEALRMACIYPLNCLKGSGGNNGFTPSHDADFVHLDDGINVSTVWQKGKMKIQNA